jgi:hypothetical protein
MKIGCPPTEPQALTGEFTPPGIIIWASLNKIADFDADIFASFIFKQSLFYRE